MKSKTNTGKDFQLSIGIFLLGLMIMLLIGFALFRPISVDIDMAHRVEPSSATYLLGTDELGRDLLSCILYGAGISLLIGTAAVILSALTGGLLGMISGLSGGVVDSIIMRLVDIFLAFPGILLAIAVAAFFSPGIFNLILVLTISGWAGYARLTRGEVLKYKQQEFILAARSYNASFARIMFHHLLPLILPLLVVQASMGISGVIIAESSLNFLGIGLDPGIPTLGQLIDAGRDYMFDNPTLIVAPGLVLFFIIIAFNFIGEGLRKKISR
jgi:ABC-type dipeptide/oligopeptide/nickel transport system permease subunit